MGMCEYLQNWQPIYYTLSHVHVWCKEPYKWIDCDASEAF